MFELYFFFSWQSLMLYMGGKAICTPSSPSQVHLTPVDMV